MKLTKIFLRYWFAITSVLSFVAGWVILAHSPKPVQPSTTTNGPVPQSNSAPIQTFSVPNSKTTNSNNGFGLFLSPSNNSGGFSIRTGGS